MNTSFNFASLFCAMRKIIILLLSIVVAAQNNYEIQVYASATQTKGSTIFELHSNLHKPFIKSKSRC